MKKLSKKMAWLFLLLNASVSCTKLTDAPSPSSQISQQIVFSTEENATSAVIGLYTVIMGTFGPLNGYLSKYAGLYADELVRRGTPGADAPYLNANISSSDETVLGIWSFSYKYIIHANAIIEGLERAAELSQPVKSRLLGETKFLRALTYFYLVNLFGDVPLVTIPDFRVNNTLPRSPEALVYQQIIADLQYASTLAGSYPSDNSHGAAKIRVTGWASTALLARVYLYRGNWSDAEATASSVIRSGTFSLERDLDRVFLSSSSEAILQFMPVGERYNSAEGAFFLPAAPSARPPYFLRNFLAATFEPNDARKARWTKSTEMNGQTLLSPFKFKVHDSDPPATEYNMVLRLAEQFLIRAEARTRQNNVTGAIADLNIIRDRAMLPPLPAGLSSQQVMAAVEKERSIELFAEWGHRWFDLRRWPGIVDPAVTRADEVLGTLKPDKWKPDCLKWPVPYSEIQKNFHFVQNPGYN